MTKTVVFPVAIQFGDCDPAGIVFYPNFLKWMDSASLHYFMTCGIPPWNVTEKTLGIVGTPLLEVNVKFLKAATYPEKIEVHTFVEHWRAKVFVQHHTIKRGADILCEGRETRTFVRREADGRMRSIPVPADFRALCE
jgi:4-hydroxybenzoyl-CoA thioesterase